MNDMKKTKEGVNLKKKKFLRLKNTGSILVLMGLLIIFVIALYTFILQSSYTKTALDTEIARDTLPGIRLKSGTLPTFGIFASLDFIKT